MARKDTPQDIGNEMNEIISADKPSPEIPADTPPAGTALATTAPAPVAAPTKRSNVVAGYDVAGVGTGFEDFDQNDLAIPFVVILQKGSPQVEDENPKRIEGAKPGMLMNTVSGKLYDGKAGVIAIPVHRKRSFIEWIPKDDGGGLVNVFEPEDKEVKDALAAVGRKKFGKIPIGDGNELAETYNVYCILVGENGFTERVVLSFASSQIGAYKKWMTNAQSIQVEDATSGRKVVPPMFSHRYLLRTFYFQKKDQTWYKWSAEFVDGSAEAARIPEGDALIEQAKEFRAMVMSGAAEADYERLGAQSPDGGAGGDDGFEI
jgi:hypothetical protein